MEGVAYLLYDVAPGVERCADVGAICVEAGRQRVRLGHGLAAASAKGHLCLQTGDRHSPCRPVESGLGQLISVRRRRHCLRVVGVAIDKDYCLVH